MHPDHDTPERHLAREPFPEPAPDTTCPGCEGDGLCHYDDAAPGERCEWCGGSGVYVRPEPSPEERRARVRALEAALRQIDSTGRPPGRQSPRPRRVFPGQRMRGAPPLRRVARVGRAARSRHLTTERPRWNGAERRRPK